jgi:hypothetical protein
MSIYPPEEFQVNRFDVTPEQFSYKLPWLQKLQINLLTTKPGDDVGYHAIESEIDEENGLF